MSERISPGNTLKGFRLAATPVSDSSLSVLVGQALSISLLPSKEALAAIVTKISSHDIWLDLPYITPDSVPQVGESVSVRYWNEEAAYTFDSQILKVTRSTSHELAISRPLRVSVAQPRQGERSRKQVLFTFTVVRAQQKELIGRCIQNARTLDISAGGLKFKTECPLKSGDRLEISLNLSPSQELQVPASVAWFGRLAGRESDWSVGLEFLDLEPEDRNHLLVFLAKTGYGGSP